MFAHDRWTRASWRREERRTHRPRVGGKWVAGWLRCALAAAMVAVSTAAEAHGIVGNRVFPGTLAFDDPAVMDELVFPASTILKHPRDGADVTDNRLDWSFTRLLTSTVSIGVDGGWIHRNWGAAQRSGFDTTALVVKDLLYKNELHEVMISAGLAWGIGHSGAQGVGANNPDTIVPGILFGKGFGDAPDGISWLRPFAVTGAITLEHPMTGASINYGVDAQTGELGPMLTRNVDTLHWGFSVQYSTFYLSNRYTPGRLPKNEPLNQFIPLVEFAFDSLRGEKTAATMNPGLAYVGSAWQLAAEAVIPLNTEGGRTIGMRAHLFLFLDDLMPALFGKPLLGQ
jgi:hypothetical protein